MIADIAHILATPITAFENMDWDEALAWHDQARRIAGMNKGS